MNKELSKAIMNRSRLKNRYNKTPTGENESKYKKQRNLFVKLLKRAKRKYCDNIDIKNLVDNRKFRKNIKPLFSEKQKKLSKITLIDNDVIVSDDKQLAEIFNNFFVESVPNIELSKHIVLNESLEDIIKAHENHTSILYIKNTFKIESEFSFAQITTEKIEEIKNLDNKKAIPMNEIPTKILKISVDTISPILERIFKNAMNLNNFPTSLTLADIIPTHKKDETTKKGNYRPLSLLPGPSKIIERDMYKQMYTYIETYLSPHLCGFRKGYNTEDCLIVMIENWRKALDNKEKAGRRHHY